MDKPLAGLKVVELARILAGPWAGQLLADLGAEVIKVERPGTRRRHARAGARPSPPDGSAAYFHGCNRGKTIGRDRSRERRGAGAGARSRPRRRRPDREFQGRRPRQIRARLCQPRRDQPAPHLLLDHRLRPGRALCRPRRLRLHDPGHGRDHGPDRRARRRAAEDRRRLRRHLHRPLRDRSRSWPRCAGARRPARAAISTWRCSTSRSRCSPTRR